MGIFTEIVEAPAKRFTRLQWIAAGLVMGLFLAFVDTLVIATILGALELRLPKWFGIPTTFSGYLVAGMIAGKFAPEDMRREFLFGILVCVWLFVWGFYGWGWHGGMFIVYFIVIPAIAAAVAHGGMLLTLRRIGSRRSSPDTDSPETQ
jgi:MFS family permease